MAKKKLQQFAELKTFKCVFEPDNETVIGENFYMKGNWHRDYFKNENPITLELGCGKGEYTIALAGMFPNRNFIGIDIKGARMWRGAKTVEQSQMKNVAFLRMRIEFITHFFASGEVDEIWLTFSDPQPRDRKGSKRLTAQRFLEKYSEILTPGGSVHVKTDSDVLYRETMKTILEGNHEPVIHADDIYGNDHNRFSPQQREILSVRTFYENKFLAENEKIKYIHFQLNEQLYQNK